MLRFAISPTSDMNISQLRVAVFNYIVSQQKKEQFLVRIDDIQKEKNIEGKDTEIMMILEKFAIKHDTLYHQTQHLNIYQNLAVRLFQEKKAYKDDSQLIVKMADEHSLVIIDKDKNPTPIFASACDDMLSEISLIIEEKAKETDIQKELYITSLLGYNKNIESIFLPDLEEITLQSLLKEGFIPDAILNYLILLGNKKAPKEIFTLPKAIEWFDLDAIGYEKFDKNRLRAINQEHLKLMDDKRLSSLFGFADSDIGKLAKLYLDELATTEELKDKVKTIFGSKNFDNKWQEQMRIIEKIIYNAPAFNTLDELKKHITKESGLDGESLSKPLAILLTGNQNEPRLDKVYSLIKSYILEVAS